MIPFRKKIFLGGVLALALPAWTLSLWWLFSVSMPSPSYPSQATVEFTLPPGTGFRRAAELLAESNLIPSVQAFLALGYLRGASGRIKAGTYEFRVPVTATSLLDILLRGKIKLHQILIPEGFNMYQIAEALELVGITGREDFLRSARDSDLLHELGIESDSVEGHLYPDTYSFAPGVPPELVIRAMVKRFREVFSPLWEKAAAGSSPGFSEHDLVTIASLIEKETSVASERPLISAVFHNRLQRKMRLDCDPTVIYGMWEQFRGNLRRQDLERRNPYNTYRIRGLPPGPIASPGRDSLRAALQPADVPFIFFVSRNDGTHYFSTSLSEHNRAVRLYQETER